MKKGSAVNDNSEIDMILVETIYFLSYKGF